MATLKYALRYVPLLLLALIAVPAWLTARQPMNDRFFPIQTSGVQPTPPVQEASPHLPGTTPYDIVMLSSQKGWIVGGEFRREMDKKQYIERTRPDSGVIWHYEGAGETGRSGGWRMFARVAQPLFSVSFADERTGWAVGYGGILVHYDGVNWITTPGPTSVNINLNSVDMVSPTEGWAVGQSGVILRYDGQAWVQQASPTQVDLNAITMLNAQEGWAVGEQGTMLHYRDGHWRRIPVPVKDTLNDITMLDVEEGWAVGESGTILHYRKGVWGIVCQGDCRTAEYASNYSTRAPLTGVAMTSSQHGYIVYSAGLLEYRGEVWSNADASLFGQYASSGSVLLKHAEMLLPTEGWIIGQENPGRNGGEPIVFHYQEGKWAVYHI